MGLLDPFTPVDHCALGLQLMAAAARLMDSHGFVVAITREGPTDANHCVSEGNNNTPILKQ